MQFLYPTILWALAALLIPIIIHLFYFRRFKNVYFSNIRFLKEIKEETSTRNRLKNLLILLSRLAAFALLIAAFAQPFIPQGKKVTKGSKEVSVFVDNSNSMKALSSDIPLFDKAKQKAREIVSAYSNEHQFQIITHDFEVKQQRLLTKEDALSAIDELQTTPSVKGLDRIYQRQLQALEGDNRTLYILSDFQKTICDIKTPIDTSLDMFLVPFQSVQEKNIAIDSAWLETPVPVLNQTNRVLVKITNYSDLDADNVRLTINQNGTVKPLGQVNLKPRETIVDTVNISILKSGWQNINLGISDYPIKFDDNYLLSFLVEPSMNVLSLNEGTASNYLNAAFKGLTYFKLDNKAVSKFQYSELKNYKLVILNEIINPSSGLISEISDYILNGGNVLVFPSKNADKNAYNSLFNALAVDEIKSLQTQEKKVFKINTEEYIFNEVYLRNRTNLKLPITQSNFEFTRYSNRGRQELLWYRDGTPFLMKYKKERGHLYLCASPLNPDQNDLARNAEVFIPMLFKMSISQATLSIGSYTIGKNLPIEVNQKIDLAQSTFKIKGETEFIPKQIIQGSKMILDVDDQISKAGFYTLEYQDQIIKNLAFNYDRTESDLSYHNTDELTKLYQPLGIGIIDNSLNADFTQIIGEKEKGILLWKWCLIFALMFLAIESFLVRFWK